MGRTDGKRMGAAAMAAMAFCGACSTASETPITTIADHRPEAGNVVLDWNVVALRTTAAAPVDPPRESRNLAIVHGAVFDAVNSIVGGFRPSRASDPAPRTASTAAAVAAAAHHVLVALYPAQRGLLDEAYAAALGAVGDGAAKQAGITAGEQAAAQTLAARAGDHADDPAPSTGRTPVGIWRPELPAFKTALDPGWGGVTPFALLRPSQFRPPAPYALTSRAYARDLNEVKAVGSAASAVRTADQTATARFWAATAPQEWNQPARQMAEARHLSLVDTARLFAQLNFAEADAAIAAWDTKFTFDQWRPITGIRQADADRNRATTADREWTPLLPTPPFPDYVCGHSALGGAAEAVLESFFGRRPGVVLTMTSAATPEAIHRYSTFRAIGDEVVDARVWAGVHWRTSCVAGRSMGRRVGRFVTTHTMLPARARRA